MRILYVVNNAAFFCSHRLPIAIAARERGHEVALASGQAGSPKLEAAAIEKLAAAGVAHMATRFSSGRIDVVAEIAGLLELWRIMRVWPPDLVHCASPKGLLYGGIAARLANVPAVILAVSGMGSLFTGVATARTRLLRRVYMTLARFAFGHPNKHLIVQNEDDMAMAIAAGLADPQDITLIPGSGVDLGAYVPLPIAGRDPIVVFPARLLKDKGLLEFVDAAKRLRPLHPAWRFVLAGTADYRNPSSVSEAQVAQWVADGSVEWWGHCDDMPSVFGQASIVCLPSYREGMPKALLEAAAAGCAIVTTDTVGCREAIIPGKTGDMVPVGDSKSLADAIQSLMADHARRARYAIAGRILASERFGLDSVIRTTLDIYGDRFSGKH